MANLLSEDQRLSIITDNPASWPASPLSLNVTPVKINCAVRYQLWKISEGVRGCLRVSEGV